MTAAAERIGGDSAYDRATALAESLGVRVVVTDRSTILERYGLDSGAVCAHRDRIDILRRLGLDNHEPPFDLSPGEARIFIATEYDGDALVLLHELGHAELHRDWRPRKGKEARPAIQRREVEAWRWAIEALGRALTDEERGTVTRALRSYGMSMKEIRTHVLPKPPKIPL